MKKQKKLEEKDIKFYSTEIKRKNVASEDSKKVVSFVITLLVVLVCIALLFIFNDKYVSNKTKTTTTTTTKTIEYDDSLLTVDTIFSVSDTNYYVLVYDSKDEIEGFYYNSLANVNLEDTPVYSVDLSLKMNSDYYNKDKKESIEEGKFNFVKPTLLTINKGKIKSYTTDKKEIANILK